MTHRNVIDARLLNAIPDISEYHFPLLTVQVLMPRFKSTKFSTTDHSNAYHQVALKPETQKLVSFTRQFQSKSKVISETSTNKNRPLKKYEKNN